MSFVININNNIKHLERYMNSLEKKQLHLVQALALNKIALLSQKHICKAIPRIFNNSRNWWDRGQRTGIKVEFADKYKRSSAVYTKGSFCKYSRGRRHKKTLFG